MTTKNFKEDETLAARIREYKEILPVLKEKNSVPLIIEPHRDSRLQPRVITKWIKKIDGQKRHASVQSDPNFETTNVPTAESGAFRVDKPQDNKAE